MNSSSVRGRSDRSTSSSRVREHRREELRHAAARSASRTCCSTGSASSIVASARSASRSDQPRFTSASRASVASFASATSAVGGAELLLQLEHHSLRGLQAYALDRLEPFHVVARDRAAQFGRRRARDDGERDLGTDAGDAEQQLEQLTLVGCREPVQLQRVLADDRVNLDRDLAAAEPLRRRRGMDEVADAVDVDDQAASGPPRDPASQARDHASTLRVRTDVPAPPARVPAGSSIRPRFERLRPRSRDSPRGWCHP